MQLWRELLSPHRYPQDLDRIAQEFHPQLYDHSCAPAAVRYGLLLGGLTIPEGALSAIFRTYPDGIDGGRLNRRLHDLGLEPEFRKKLSGESTRQFLERLGQEMDRGAFVLACIYGGWHWITLGRWDGGRIWAVDSNKVEHRAMYTLTPESFDRYRWEDCVRLVRPGIWQRNYEEWLPGRGRLLRMTGHPPEARATMAQRLRAAAHGFLNGARYDYNQMEFFLSEKTSVTVEVSDSASQAISVSMPTANEQEGQVAVVRRLDEVEAGGPGPPEVIFRVSALRGWQLRSGVSP